MRRFLIAAIVFAIPHISFAQMDDLGTGEGFPTEDCKVAANNFVGNVGPKLKKKIKYNPEENLYDQMIDALNKASEIAQAKLSKNSKSGKSKNQEALRNQFEREKSKLLSACEYISWSDGLFQKVEAERGRASSSPSPAGSN
jgi:hypothetical protein